MHDGARGMERAARRAARGAILNAATVSGRYIAVPTAGVPEELLCRPLLASRHTLLLCFGADFQRGVFMALFSKEVAAPARPQPRPDQPAAGPGGTFFGREVTIEGTVSGSEPIVIEGIVKGNIRLNADLRIGTQARVEAAVHARNVIIEGKLVGDVSADDRVELVASSSVDGNIKAPKIIVAEGARFRGAVDMGSARPKEHGEGNPNKAK